MAFEHIIIFLISVMIIILFYEILEKRSKIKELEKINSLKKEKLAKIEADEEEIIVQKKRISNVKFRNARKLQEIKAEYKEEMLKISSRTEEEIHHLLIKEIRDEHKHEILKITKNFEKDLKKKKNIISQKILLDAMENSVVDITKEFTIEDLEIPNPEMKGKFIGKDGRNIKLIENLLKVNLIIDERPNTISVSSLNPVRRAVAYSTIKELITTGIVNQNSIEETYIKHEHLIETIIIEHGKEAFEKLNLNSDKFNFSLIRMVGKLYFRSSYGQNVLQHSIEVAKICGSVAVELNLDYETAALSGLLHDIGKVESQQTGVSHDILGRKMLLPYIEDENILNAVEAHHGRVDPSSEYAVIVEIADTISAARVGARNGTHDKFLERIESMEKIAYEFAGVKSAFALSGGREIRVVVNPYDIEDAALTSLAKNITTEIESKLTFPGVVKVHLIREMKVITETGKKELNEKNNQGF